MSLPELRLAFVDLAAFERELQSNLKYGRSFSTEVADLQVLSDCLLVLAHPLASAELRLPAQVVMVNAEGPMRGTGIELRPFGPVVLEQIESFMREPPPPTAAVTECAETAARSNVESMIETAPEVANDLSTASAEDAASTCTADDNDGPTLDDVDADDNDDDDFVEEELIADPDAPDSPDELLNDASEGENAARAGKSLPPDQQREHKQDKLRHLSVNEQLKIARTGELSDRVTIERLYGKQVWDALLHNPRLTIPEVARIARKGTVPKPLLELIVENGAWIKTPQVRRALLGNPKVGADSIAKLLRVTPKHELKLIEKGTAYAMPVREAARKLLKQ